MWYALIYYGTSHTSSNLYTPDSVLLTSLACQIVLVIYQQNGLKHKVIASYFGLYKQEYLLQTSFLTLTAIVFVDYFTSFKYDIIYHISNKRKQSVPLSVNLWTSKHCNHNVRFCTVLLYIVLVCQMRHGSVTIFQLVCQGMDL